MFSSWWAWLRWRWCWFIDAAIVAPYALVLGVGVALVIVLTAWQTTIWRVGAVDFAIVPFALALLLAWFAPRLRLEARLLWVWFGGLLLLTFFGVALARTHIYVFFTPWALLVGGLLANGWHAPISVSEGVLLWLAGAWLLPH